MPGRHPVERHLPHVRPPPSLPPFLWTYFWLLTTEPVKNSCWDGKNLDSPNHKDHVAHPVDGPAPFAMVDGRCPDSHPVKIPQVHYEVSTPLRHGVSSNKQGVAPNLRTCED